MLIYQKFYDIELLHKSDMIIFFLLKFLILNFTARRFAVKDTSIPALVLLWRFLACLRYTIDFGVSRRPSIYFVKSNIDWFSIYDEKV